MNLGRSDLGLPRDAVLYWCCQSAHKFLPCYDEVFPRIAREVPGCRFVFIRYTEGERVNEIFQPRRDRAFAAFGLSSREYCILLPRLDPKRRQAARAEIVAKKHLLYSDHSCIRVLEDFLIGALLGGKLRER